SSTGGGLVLAADGGRELGVTHLGGRGAGVDAGGPGSGPARAGRRVAAHRRVVGGAALPVGGTVRVGGAGGDPRLAVAGIRRHRRAHGRHGGRCRAGVGGRGREPGIGAGGAAAARRSAALVRAAAARAGAALGRLAEEAVAAVRVLVAGELPLEGADLGGGGGALGRLRRGRVARHVARARDGGAARAGHGLLLVADHARPAVGVRVAAPGTAGHHLLGSGRSVGLGALGARRA